MGNTFRLCARKPRRFQRFSVGAIVRRYPAKPRAKLCPQRVAGFHGKLLIYYIVAKSLKNILKHHAADISLLCDICAQPLISLRQHRSFARSVDKFPQICRPFLKINLSLLYNYFSAMSIKLFHGNIVYFHQFFTEYLLTLTKKIVIIIIRNYSKTDAVINRQKFSPKINDIAARYPTIGGGGIERKQL